MKITSKSWTGKTETARLIVLGEVTLQSKLFAASVAAKGLNVAVGLHMSPQVALVRKTLAALVTVVRLLPCVGPDVTLEQPGPGEGLATEGALAARGVGPHVHVQGRWDVAEYLSSNDWSNMLWLNRIRPSFISEVRTSCIGSSPLCFERAPG